MTIIKNFLYNTAYQVLVLVLPFITIPYVSRVIGPEGVGMNGYTSSIASYFVLFGSIGLGYYGNRQIAYVRDDNKKLRENFWEISFLKLLFMAISTLLFLLYVIFIEETNKFYLFLQVFMLLAAAIDISWFYMGIENFKKTVTRNFVLKLLSVLLIFVLVKSKEDIYLYILILSASVFLGNLTLWWNIKKYVGYPSFIKLENLKIHIRPSVALFVPQISLEIYGILNRTMLGKMGSIDAVGYFVNANNLVRIILSLVTSIGVVMLPRMSYLHSKGDKKKVEDYLTKSFNAINFLSIPLFFGLASIIEKFSPIFFGKSFDGIGRLIVVMSPMILAIAWSNVIGTQYLIPTNQIKLYTISVTVGTVVNLILNLFLIPTMGYTGTGLSSVISEFLIAGLQIYLIRKQINMKKLFKEIPVYFLCSIIMFITVIFAEKIIGFSVVKMFIQVIIGMIVYFGLIVIFKPSVYYWGLDIIRKKLKG